MSKKRKSKPGCRHARSEIGWLALKTAHAGMDIGHQCQRLRRYKGMEDAIDLLEKAYRLTKTAQRLIALNKTITRKSPNDPTIPVYDETRHAFTYETYVERLHERKARRVCLSEEELAERHATLRW